MQSNVSWQRTAAHEQALQPISNTALQVGLIQSEKPTRLVVGRSVSVKLSFRHRDGVLGAD
jgi:hypothetical protein